MTTLADIQFEHPDATVMPVTNPFFNPEKPTLNRAFPNYPENKPVLKVVKWVWEPLAAGYEHVSRNFAKQLRKKGLLKCQKS